MKITNGSNRNYGLAVAVLAMGLLLAPASAATWTGNGADDFWSTAGNWDTAPSNPTGDAILFDDQDAANPNTFDSALAANWQIGSLSFEKVGGDQQATVFNLDLGGYTLSSDGALEVGDLPGNFSPRENGTISTNITNGTLVIGSAGQRANLIVAQNYTRRFTATLTMGPGSSIDMRHLNSFYVAQGNVHEPGLKGRLDLRDATIVGGGISANTLWIGEGGRTTETDPQSGIIYVDDSSGLSSIDVAGTWLMGRGPSRVVESYFGDPDNDWKLPANVDINVGVDAANRGELLIASDPGAARSDITAKLAASSGGTFTGYLTTLEVAIGSYDGRYGQTTDVQGTLDLAAMNSITLDVAGPIQAGLQARVDDVATGRILLPDGTVTATSTELGAENTAGEGYLELNGTEMTTGSLTLHESAEIIINSFADGGGIYVTSSAAGDLAIADGGIITINFAGDPDSWDNLNGLRVEGDRVSELQALETAGKLVLNTANLSPAVQQHMHWAYDDAGYTLLVVPEPATLSLLALAGLAAARRRRRR